MIADDLFAGAGGWDLAAEALGIEARGVEIMPEARATREAAGLKTIHDDVWTFSPSPDATGLIASPPCQTFSQAGKGAGRKALDNVLRAIDLGGHKDLAVLKAYGEHLGDERTSLVLTPLHFATTGPYRWLAWEQVPTVLPLWEACASVLRGLGWSVWTGYLFSEQYGVPQTRKRAFLLASLDGEVAMPTPTHSRYYARDKARLDPGVKKWVSMAEALGWGDGVMVSNYGTGGDASKRGTRNLDEPAPTVTSKIDRNRIVGMTAEVGVARQRDGHKPFRSVDEPAFTVHGGSRNGEGGGIRHRWSMADGGNGIRLTVGEAGVLQSFPAPYPWQGKKHTQLLQCGNAVPPGMALHALAAASGLPLPNLTSEESVA